MLNFNSKGLLFPNTSIPASVDDLKYYFVNSIPSETRYTNFKKYTTYSDDLKKLLAVKYLKQWINGSFVTMTRNPRDIDLVSFIDYELRIKLYKQLKNFEAEGANKIYGVDAYILTVFPDNHTNKFLFQSDKSYWEDKFTRTRRDILGKKIQKDF